MASWSQVDIPDLTGKRALVTGAASGSGFEATAALARRGATALLADRNAEGGAAAVRRIR